MSELVNFFIEFQLTMFVPRSWTGSAPPTGRTWTRPTLTLYPPLHVQEELPLQDTGAGAPPGGAQRLRLQPHQKQYGRRAASQSGPHRHPQPPTPNIQVAGSAGCKHGRRAPPSAPMLFILTALKMCLHLSLSACFIHFCCFWLIWSHLTRWLNTSKYFGSTFCHKWKKYQEKRSTNSNSGF